MTSFKGFIRITFIFLSVSAFSMQTFAKKPKTRRPAAEPMKNLVVIGQIPGRYFDRVDSQKMVLGYLEIENRVIKNMGQLEPRNIADFIESQNGKTVLQAKRSGQRNFDVIYPGLINLHNHTKQNNLPIWSDAVGQFANRFEWRDWPNYKFAVSGNMNPWVDYARAVECATFRWSELQALTLGTVYLQGPSSCVENFGIQRVEDAESVISTKAAVQAPTDLVMPNEMQYVWNVLGPEIRSGKTYEEALAANIKKHCESIPVTASNVNSPEMLKIFKDQGRLVELCQKEGLPDKFIRYVYWVHPTIAGRKNYFGNLAKPFSAVIAHLAEGRRDDPYNQKEWEIVKLLGLDVARMNFVHGVGIPSSVFPELAKKKIGLIWSPFSNLLLYSQTLDVATAHKAGVRLALGSDWVPTGTKSVLEELKLARRYILKDMDKENLLDAFTGGTKNLGRLDEELFKMVTENPAEMLGYNEIVKGTSSLTQPSGIIESAIGRLAVGAMGSFIIVSALNDNPYTNLVAEADEKHINLVVVEGKPVYGNVSYLQALGFGDRYEVMAVDSEDFARLSELPSTGPSDKTPETLLSHVVKIVTEFSSLEFRRANKCKFDEEKALVNSESVEADSDLVQFRNLTGLNLDRAKDIAELLAINILTQNRNKIDKKEGKTNFSLKYFPSLYTCNDTKHADRISNFIKIEGDDEFEKNRKFRNEVIEKQKLGRGPVSLAEKYK